MMFGGGVSFQNFEVTSGGCLLNISCFSNNNKIFVELEIVKPVVCWGFLSTVCSNFVSVSKFVKIRIIPI